MKCVWCGKPIDYGMIPIKKGIKGEPVCSDCLTDGLKRMIKGEINL